MPTYGGPLDGLPLNLERLLASLHEQFGDNLNFIEWLQVPLALHELADDNEDYWERGAGSKPPRTDKRYENLGIYGWDLRDSLSFTCARATARIAGHPAHDDLLGAKPDNDNDIAAATVLAPFGPAATQLDAAYSHGRDGGIETLVVALGSNNALRTVVSKKVAWSGSDYADLEMKGRYSVWNPMHFDAEYAELVRGLLRIPARRIILATVPHVTVAPIAHGVNPANPGRKWRAGSRYFPYYTDPWIGEAAFRPNKHRHLTHQQARAIDSAIDQYNDTIVEHVRRARSEGRDWQVLDLCGLLDGLAYRRFVVDPEAGDSNGWEPYLLPDPIKDLDSRFFRSDRTGRLQGGLFGLDAVHPSVVGYGIVAQAVLDILGQGGAPAATIDFAELLKQDTLNCNPPALMVPLLDLLAPLLARLTGG